MKIILPVVAFTFTVLSCSAARPAIQSPRVLDEQTLRRIDDQERLGILNRDTLALQRLWSEQLIVNSPSNQVAPNRAAVLGLINDGRIHYSMFERTIEQLRIDGDIAFVMGGETIQPTGSAPQAGQRIKRRFTHVWKRDGAVWRLVARHANTVHSP